jgi:hypothetical protein
VDIHKTYIFCIKNEIQKFVFSTKIENSNNLAHSISQKTGHRQQMFLTLNCLKVYQMSLDPGLDCIKALPFSDLQEERVAEG